ncbi:hypothetical protein AJ79_09436 [Helicocarpus griseus UAMH5409]|uniref:Uncharacterized protein n=1 Tax=Helicocarpus griseus UAMH5409 TaxID=1447875 RepID=A0A2B7WJX2_9EURO|nr:hypothetical protein AJ79_09436 [Helicocarpus griseus UAMH5409]
MRLLDNYVPVDGSDITKIGLSQCVISSRLLGQIIALPRALEEFRYSTGNREQNGRYQHFVDLGRLGQDLRRHKSTLHVLDVDVGEHAEYRDLSDNIVLSVNYVEYSSPAYDERSGGNKRDTRRGHPDVERDTVIGKSIGSLSYFVALTLLSIGVRFLLGPDKDEVKFDDNQEASNKCSEERKNVKERLQLHHHHR